MPLGSSVSLMAGWSQDAYTAGAKVEFFAFEFSAVTYAVENQSAAFMQIERRYMGQVTWKFDILGTEFPTERDRAKRTRPRTYWN